VKDSQISKIAKWLCFYTLSSLGFSATAMLVTLIISRFVAINFLGLFFFLLFITGTLLIVAGGLIILHESGFLFPDYTKYPRDHAKPFEEWSPQAMHGIILILVGLTFLLANLFLA